MHSCVDQLIYVRKRGGLITVRVMPKLTRFFPTGLVCVCFFKLFKSFFWGGVSGESERNGTNKLTILLLLFIYLPFSFSYLEHT